MIEIDCKKEYINISKNNDFFELLDFFYSELERLKESRRGSDAYFECQKNLKNTYSRLQTLANT